jgi:hypothetical protein
MAAGLEDSTRYLFGNLKAKTIEDALGGGEKPHAFRALVDVAGNSVRGMQLLAELAAKPESPAVARVSIDLADAYGKSYQSAHIDLMHLLKHHADEWMQFRDFCGTQSWVGVLAEA